MVRQDSNRPSAGHLTPVRRHHWSALTRNWLLLLLLRLVLSSPLLSSPLVPPCCLVGLEGCVSQWACLLPTRLCQATYTETANCSANTGLLLSTN